MLSGQYLERHVDVGSGLSGQYTSIIIINHGFVYITAYVHSNIALSYAIILIYLVFLLFAILLSQHLVTLLVNVIPFYLLAAGACLN